MLKCVCWCWYSLGSYCLYVLRIQAVWLRVNAFVRSAENGFKNKGQRQKDDAKKNRCKKPAMVLQAMLAI